MKCSLCGSTKCRKDPCGKCNDEIKRHTLQKQPFVVKCKKCGGDVLTNKDREKVIKKHGIVCKKCCAAISSQVLKKIRSNQTPEERSRVGAIARSQVKNPGSAVRKQWETIRASDELRNKKYSKLKQQAVDFWSTTTDEKKNEIIGKWLKDKSRSKVSDTLKNKMNEAGFDGFTSEQPFHGFFPDEINHDLKIIVELYGDFWHCNPRKYKDPNLYINRMGRTVGEQWKRDERRLACFYKHGYTVVIIWEKDFYNDPKKQIERIGNEINQKKSIIREMDMLGHRDKE